MSNRSGKKNERNKLIVRVICIVLAVAMLATMITALLLH